ncbi:hypothetical protein ACN47E_002590 [Coniothyrium glycines]
MFSPAVGRVARSINAFSVIPAHCLHRPALCTAQQHAIRPTHQRRYSSSKPSTPPNSKKKPAEPDQSATSKLQGADKSQGAPQEKPEEPSGPRVNIPFVPPTDDLQSQDVDVSSFFGLHRPISISTPFPKKTSVEAFDALFDPIAPSKNIETAQRGVSTFEDFIRRVEDELLAYEEKQQQSTARDGPDARSTQTRLSEKEPRASRLLPFSPPPVPVPQDPSLIETETVACTAEALSAAINKHMATEVTVPEERTSTFREHIARRRYGMFLISVKRQRKLKMKKHKYKKLMKRTRLLRRKLDRT